ncbi:hypothetical protein FQN51_004972 [Onygenales sp. PD_10]|nr:hypothetical protein FQN51_004972 [Onygenales sp. PD_10]
MAVVNEHCQLPPGLQDLISSDLDLVPEDVLNRVTRGPLRDFILRTDSPQSIIPIWKRLFTTFSSNNLSLPHIVASCNAISAYLDSTALSKNEKIREFPLTGPEAPWVAAFEVFLDRYERKPKPMRQVLTSLVKIISKHRDDTLARSIRSSVIQLVIPNIILCEPRSRVKASLIALEWLVRKDALSSVEMIQVMKDWMLNSPTAWASRLEEHCANIGVPLNYFMDEEKRKGIQDADLTFYAAQNFTISLLLNANNRDLALPAGTLFTLLCHKLEAASKVGSFLYNNPDTSCPFWQGPLKYIALQNTDALSAVSDHFFYPLFKAISSAFQSFIHTFPFYDLGPRSSDATMDELIVLFSALQTAKELGLVQEDSSDLNGAASTGRPETYIMESSRIGEFLLHPEPAIRLSALALLITAPSTTKPFSSTSLQVLIENFPYMHTDSDPQYRGEVYSLIRKLIIRLRGGISVCRRVENTARSTGDNTSPRPSSNATPGCSAENQVMFLRWYVDFLELEIQQGLSYQRHIMALKALVLLLQSGLDGRIDSAHLSRLGQDQTSWDCSVEICRPTLFRLLGDLLMNAFDDVRSTALMILDMFPRDCIRIMSDDVKATSPLSQLVIALERAEVVASRTSRADHADAVARLYHLLFNLADSGESRSQGVEWFEHKQGIVTQLLEKLESNLRSLGGAFQAALRETPLHGYISALRYIVATPKFHALFPSRADGTPFWRLFHDRLILLCENIWLGVRDILCIDSPEGQDEESTDDLKGPKDLLSCSWRALRESSLLLNSVLLNHTYAPDTLGTGLDRNDFNKMGALSFTQLAELRHRGAFSAVSQTFTACCQRCGQSKDSGISSLPEEWYKGVLKIIDEQADKLTRRSAGLPALVTGIASSNSDAPLFRQIMQESQDIASKSASTVPGWSNIKLPQVHALNCLKDIFTNTKLGPSTEPYIMPCLKLSAECMGSQIWAIRNCGLMLFKALMNRMYRFKAGSSPGLSGASGSEPGCRIVFQKYPGLIELLSHLLQDPIPNTNEKPEGADSQSWELSIVTERVFPALELIGEKVPSFTGEEEKLLQSLVFQQFSSPVWSIREHSARIYASLLKPGEILSIVSELSVALESSAEQNHIHGVALCIRYALQRLWVSSSGYWLDDSASALVTVKKTCNDIFPHARSPFVQAALVEIINDAMDAGIRCNLHDVVLPQLQLLLENHGMFGALESLMAQASTDTSIPRSAFMLLRALSLSKITISLVQNHTPEELSKFVHSLCTADPDTASWILSHVHSSLSCHKQSEVERINLYISIAKHTYSERVLVAAISNLADDLESIFDNHSQVPDKFQFLQSWASSTDIIPAKEHDSAVRSRDMINASFRLQGCVLALRMLAFDDAEIPSLYATELNKWAQNLRFAISEETEFLTRHAATLSMKTFISGLKMSGKLPKLTSLLLDIHIALYDMLNDDDEELRDIAALAASELFSLSRDSSTHAAAKLPLAASSQLTEIIAEKYTGASKLFVQALCRFLGQPINASDLVIPLSAASQLDGFQRENTVLFQEEKQNLFIEDIREADIWARVLSRLLLVQTNSPLVLSLYSWVVNGLSTLAKATREAGSDGVLGWISNPDVFTLGVRVIRGAEILLLVPASEKLVLDKSLLRQKVEELLDQGQNTGMHHRWLALLKTALDSSAGV